MVINFFKNALWYSIEVVLAISEGRKPRSVKGKKEFLIILFIGLFGYIGFFILQSDASLCLDCTNNVEEKTEPTMLKSEDFKSKAQSTGSSQSQEIDYQNLYLVTKVVDGDTFKIASGQTVRLIGIDTPETSHPTKGLECFGPEASDFTKELLENREVYLQKDISETDKYGRLLRYVYLDDLFVNEYLVNEGYAKAISYPPDINNQEIFQKAEQSARNAQRGLWGTACANNSNNIQGTSDTNIHPNNQNCKIKGNISWSGEKIYHLPGCSFYEKTTIDEEKGEKHFCTEQEAQSSGFRKAQNCP